MTNTKRIANGLFLLLLSFSVLFFLFDKEAYRTVNTTVEEPRVYVTATGECYHTSSCHYLSRSKIARGLYEARSEGYRACSHCHGRAYGTITVTRTEQVKEDLTGEVAVKAALFASATVAVYALLCAYADRR